MFRDPAFRDEVDLSGVNSINWARIAAQAVYYFTSAVALGAPHRQVRYAVPTGNFGDAFAGYAARRMGLDIARIAVATNGNDILARALSEGRYATGPVHATASPAMDIQVASNFERLYFEASRRDAVETGRAFEALARDGRIDLAPQALAYMRDGFEGHAVSEAETKRTLLATLNETGELVDPPYPRWAWPRPGARRGRRRWWCWLPPTPAKFPDAVRAATGAEPALHARAQGLLDRDERIDRLPQ